MKLIKKHIDEAIVYNVLVQLVQYAVPLITYPYVAHVLGLKEFGRLSFWMALSGLLAIGAEYGFRYSAARVLAAEQWNLGQKSKLLASVQLCRLLIVLIEISVVCVCFKFGLLDPRDRLLAACASTLLFGTALFPSWFFVGLGRYRQMALIVALPRIAGLALVFVLVKTSQDAASAALALSSPILISGLAAYIYILLAKQARLTWPALTDSFLWLGRGWHEFRSAVFMAGYQMLPVVLLGMVSGHASVGAYAIADKLIQAAKGVTTAWGQVHFSRNAKNHQYSRESIRENLIVFCGANVAIQVVLIGLACALPMILGESFRPAVPVLLILSCAPVLSGAANVYGVQVLMARGETKSFARAALIAAGVSVGLGVILSEYFGATGMASAAVAAEVALVYSVVRDVRALMPRVGAI